MTIETLHLDDAFVVVDKPSMLLTVPGRGPEKQDCVVRRLEARFDWIREVHRLDWETSGVLLLARNPGAHRALSIQFQERRVAKRYQAVVHGMVEGDEGEIDLPLIGDWPNRPRQKVDHEQGKPSQTRWRMVERFGDRTHVELIPLTGRSHQLRVHMLSMGHPILGDPLYAPPGVVALADRLLLHACELRFTHPETGEGVTVTSPPPFG